jgi:hypothetical protein
MWFITGGHLSLDAEVISREHQEFVIIATGDVEILAIGTDSDHVRAFPHRGCLGDLSAI